MLGGDSWTDETQNGEGGYSYLGTVLHGFVEEGTHEGPGNVLIIPAIAGCGCYFRCVALDEFRHNVQCICPTNWMLGADNISCVRT